MLTRRRLIAISAVAVLVPLRARATPRLWTGQALGARASIRLDHPDGAAIAARVLAEIDRLEDVLSLYRPDSALSRLNRLGHLDAPPFELLDCLAIAGAVHHASGGRFDPTVQPLWALWAEAAAKGGRPAATARQGALRRTGWDGLRMDSTAITLRPGMSLTLNGIGQGYVADRVAALLAAEGLDDILIDTGELRAIGGQPGGGGWPVQLAPQGQVALRQRALATSAPRGTTFDASGLDGHVLDPHSGLPCPARWQAVSVSAPTAALADALSTAACLMPDRAAILDLLGRFNGAWLEAATPV
ncbi:MAG: FAD:protein FMN transferase [Rhodobacterales bacterium]|nr:FAD:protein FMN transferase [Rhodobacterales bacterium]MDX5501598.1 FAD:protein FMN transferase [Rhodobacterales bacterium]